MSLAKTMEEILKVKPYTEEDVDNGPRETLAGRRGRKNQAIEQLKVLKREYRIKLLESAAFIVVTGSAAADFTKIATEEFKCMNTDPDTFYKDLADRIPAALYNGTETVANLFDVIGRHLEDKAGELDINGYPQLIFKQEYRTTLKNKNDLLNLIRTAINDKVGPEIVGIQAASSLLKQAIDSAHGARVTPIVLTTDNEKLAIELEGSLGRLHPRGVFLVVAGKGTKTLKAVSGVVSVKEPTTESVGQVMNQISAATKK